MNRKYVKSNVMRIAFVLIGTVIGAGFASGAEIMVYFSQYGEAGLWAMGLAGLLFFLGTYGTLKIAYEHGNTEYGAFTETIAGKWFGIVLDVLVTFSMLLGYGVMLAGSGAIFLQQWNLPELTGTLLMAGATALALYFGAEGVMAVNRYLTPILIVGIMLVGCYGIWSSSPAVETVGLSLQPLSIFTAQPVENISRAFGSAAIYASYNMLGAGAVLVGFSGYLLNAGEAAKVGVCSAGILVVLTLVLGLATFLNYDTIVDIPIPALELLRDQKLWGRLYFTVLFGAMYTTAVADGFGFMNRMTAIWPIGRGKLCLIMTALALLLSRMGFESLVSRGYRFLGYLGIGQMLLIIIKCIPKKENINGRKKRRKRKPG